MRGIRGARVVLATPVSGASGAAATLVVAVFAAYVVTVANVMTAAPAVRLPVEVVGDGGTTVSVAVDVPAGRAREARSLWMQIHGVHYADMISVQINGSPWFAVNNDTVVVAEPGKSYGGIGGA